MRFILLLMVVMAMTAQQTKFPARVFHDGEVLKVVGALITIRVSGEAAFFVAHGTDPGVDRIEIQAGYEAPFAATSEGKILRFATMTAPLVMGADVLVGDISDLSKLRTVRILLLKAKAEEMFR